MFEVVLGLFCVSIFAFWFLIDVPDNFKCVLLLFLPFLPVFFYLCWRSCHCHRLSCHHSPVLRPASMMQRRLWQNRLCKRYCCKMNTCMWHIAGGLWFTCCFLFYRKQQLLHSGMLAFRVLENPHNLRGLMKNKELSWQIIWIHSLLEISGKFLLWWIDWTRVSQFFSYSIKTHTIKAQSGT